MRLWFALALVLFLAPQKQTDSKRVPQKQVQPTAINQNSPDSTRPIVSGTQFYTYNSQQNDRAETVKIISDILLAVFTAALVWVGWQQWRTLREHEAWMQKHDAHLEKLADAAKKNAEVSESAFKLGQRADVLLEGATFSHGQVLSEKDTRVVLQFRNFGRTRADSSRLSLNLLIDGVPPTDNTLVPSVVIGAGDTQKISSARFVEFLTQTTAQGVLSGKTILRFESEIAYKDIFGDSHRSYYEGTLDVGAGVFKIDKQEAD